MKRLFMQTSAKLFRSREVKYRVIDRHVGFDFVDNNSLFVRRSFASELD
jgi:hypothetical protein